MGLHNKFSFSVCMAYVQNKRIVISKPCKRLWQSVPFQGEYVFFHASRSEWQVFSSLRCGCPVDASAKQKHRPSRQARPPLGAWQSASPLNRHYKTFYYGSVLKKQLQYLSNYDILIIKFNMLCEVCRKLRFFRSRRSNTLRCRKGAIKLYADSAPEKSYYGCRRCKAFL